MGINLDRLKPQADVTIGLLDYMICVDFARAADSDVLKDLLELKKKPGFRVYSGVAEFSYHVWIAAGYLTAEVAEAIAVCFEEDHNLRVRRLITNEKAIDKTPSLPVALFY